MELVSLRHEEVVCTSLDVAERFGKEHFHVLRDIENLIGGISKSGDTPKKSGFLKIEESTKKKGLPKIGDTPFFQKSTYINKQNGQTYPMYYMNRDGFTLLAMGFTGKKALEWKIKYIEAFNEMEKVILNQKNAEWLHNREQGKISRKVETDALKEFVRYATQNGSENGDKYYTLFTKMANSFAGITKRDFANAQQLWHLSVLENALVNFVIEEMEQGIEYHKIYRDCKERLALIQNLAYLKG